MYAEGEHHSPTPRNNDSYMDSSMPVGWQVSTYVVFMSCSFVISPSDTYILIHLHSPQVLLKK